MTRFSEGYRNPTYFVEGAKVIIPCLYDGKLRGLICTVKTACGDVGRVVCEKYGVDKWVKLEDTAGRDGDPLGLSKEQIAHEIEGCFEC